MPQFTVDPAGRSFSLTQARIGAANVTLFSNPAMTTAVTLPQTFNTPRTFYVRQDADYNLTLTWRGVTLALPNTTLRGEHQRYITFQPGDRELAQAVELCATVAQLPVVPAPPTRLPGFRTSRSVTAAVTAATDEVIFANATTAGFSVTLPAASATASVVVKKVDASVNTVTVVPPGAQTIDGAASHVLSTQFASAHFQSDGTNWFLV